MLNGMTQENGGDKPTLRMPPPNQTFAEAKGIQQQLDSPDCTRTSGQLIRVAFVLHAMQVAGAEVLVMETIRRLAGLIEPVIFCLDKVGALGERMRAEGVEVLCFNRRPGRDLGVAWRMARAIREHRIEVLHAHQYTPFFYAALARVLAGGAPRLILTEHGRHFPDGVSRLRHWTNRLAFDWLADAVNACCAFSGQALADVDGFSGRRIEIIENGIEVERYGNVADRVALRLSLGLESARRYVITVARFHPIKDHATLLRAFASVATARPDVDLLLVGDGELRGSLEQHASSLGLENRVRFLGVRSDIPALLQAADVFAMTSLCEAASLTILEAMASRLPVVVTEVGGNPEMVRQDIDGMLVPRGDAAGAAAALVHLLDNAAVATAMGAAGRERVEERYHLSHTAENYGRLYRKLCGRRT